MFSCVAATACCAADKITVLHTGPQAGHYLSWHGHPILLVGDSVTQGWMECGTNFDQRAYVDALAARGINLLMLWAFKGTDAQHQRQDRRLGYDAPELWPWFGSPDSRSFDLHRFNPLYFERLQQLVGYAESKQVAVLLTIHDGWTKTCFGGHPLNRLLGNGPLSAREQYTDLSSGSQEMPAAFDPGWDWKQQNQYFQERFCAELISALQRFGNVMYEMFNEGEWYDRAKRRRHEEHFLSFFRRRCDNLLLSNTDSIAGDSPHADPKLDVITLHPQPWQGCYPQFVKGFRVAPAKPYFCSEIPEFDGAKPPLEELRRNLWEVALAGAGWVNQNDASFGWDQRTMLAAQSKQRDLAYDAAGHCARFLNRSGVRFWRMSPHPALSSTGVCLAEPGAEYLVYSPASGPLTLDLSAAAGHTLAVRWLNPRTGEMHTVAPVQGGDRAESLKPPFTGDAVLYLQSEAK